MSFSPSPIPRRGRSAAVARWWVAMLLALTLVAGLIVPATARAAESRLVTDSPPAAPTHVQATARTLEKSANTRVASISVTWSPPGTQQGPPVTQYLVSAYIDGARTAAPMATVLRKACATTDGTTTCMITLTNITPDATYVFVVQAQNTLGLSAESNRAHPVTWIPGESAPSAPLSIQVSPAVDSAAVHWTPPYSGGNPIDAYEVTVYDGASHHVLSSVAVKGGTTGTTITKLDPAALYSFSVRAANALGWGPESLRSGVVETISTPGAPTSVTAQAAPSSATIKWVAPDDGGSPITGYIVRAFVGYSSDQAAEVDTFNGATTSVTFHGIDRPLLRNGVAYTFTVTATNGAGSGPESQRSNEIVPALLPPGPPTNVRATAGITSASVAWAAPDDYGSPIQGYVVRAYLAGTRVYEGGLTAPAGARTATLTGLAGGQSYDFTVNAVNAVGYGPESIPSNPVTLATTPSPPVAVRAAAAVHTATVTWAAPFDGGSPITGYVVTAQPAGGAQATSLTVTGAARSVTFFNLSDGTTYGFQVVAYNAVGASPAAPALFPVTLPAPAGPPRDLSVSPDAGSARARWSAPASDGGSPIIDYEVSASDGSHTPLVLRTTDTSATITGLSDGTTYTVEVRAINAAGRGGAASATVTPRNLQPALQVPGAQSGSYGDGLSFNVSASDPEAGDRLTLSAETLPDGLTFTDHGNGTGTVSGTLQAAAGTYTISMAVSDGHNAQVTRSVALTVARAAAQVTPQDLTGAVRVAGSSGSVSLQSEISAATHGSIVNAVPVTFVLTSFDSGAAFRCGAGTSVSGATLTATCRLDKLPVDVYRVHVEIGGDYYAGSADSLLTVYHPSKASIRSYGGLRHGDLQDSFKLQAQYGKRGNATGFLTFVEHQGARDRTLKSTSLTGLVIKRGRAYIQGTARLDGVGGYRFAATVTHGAGNHFSLWLADAHHQLVTDLSFGPAMITSRRTQIAQK